MAILATYDMHWGHGNDHEIIRRGDPIPITGTLAASRAENERYAIKNGWGVREENWAKYEAKTAEGWAWAQEQTAKNNAASKRRAR